MGAAKHSMGSTKGRQSGRRVGWLSDPRLAWHQGPPGHPERPERLDAVALAAEPMLQRLVAASAREAQDGELLHIHTPEHLARLAALQGEALQQLDADTYLAPRSLEAARLAAGGLVDLCSEVMRGNFDCGIAALRPPGHHAEADRAMGFCLFNQVAVAASVLRSIGLAERVLIIDWDVHHGNGTQHSFEAERDVFYVSTHQYPYYPGTGAATEIGVERGTGATLNIPMGAGCGDAEYIGVFQRLVSPAARAFAPDVILVSAGFDPHVDDPLAAMRMGERGFEALADITRQLADALCGGRIIFSLEGGYAATGLAAGTRAVLRAALADEVPTHSTLHAPSGSTLARLIDPVCEIHGARIPDLGTA